MHNQSVKAILMVHLALFALLLSDNLVKYLTQYIPLMQLIFCRALFAAVFIALFLLQQGRVRLLKTPYPKMHLVRGLLFATVTLGFMVAIREFPIAVVATAFAGAPLLITAASPWLLKEKVSPLQWWATGAGFAGVVLILRPDTAVIDMNTLALLYIPIGYCLVMIFSKEMNKRESGWVLNFYGFATIALLVSYFAFYQWQPMSAELWATLLASTFSGVLGFGCLIYAYHLGKASFVAPFEYNYVLLAMASDIFIWHLIPGVLGVLGVVLIVGCGVLQVYAMLTGESYDDSSLADIKYPGGRARK